MPFKPVPGGVSIRIRVTPRGGADRVEGPGTDSDGAPHIKLRVSAIAEKGKANEAVLKLLARSTGLPRAAFSIASGETGRMKAVLVAGEPDALLSRLERWAAQLPERRK